MEKIPAEYLPAKELWPERIYTLPEHASYPQRLNSTEELMNRHAERRALSRNQADISAAEATRLA